ncbi:hypothetical protein DFH29DRAFT_909598 [Suillus ampliporus]|nr:hypothetical protein DFH29DRAFT_909598 [Suillus ampliporus]
MSNVNGLPLLSGAPPTPSTDRIQNACRKCNKEFILFFTRATRCNHCGYSYCPSCADDQVLMPRHGAASGYDQVRICEFCIELLNITAATSPYRFPSSAVMSIHTTFPSKAPSIRTTSWIP